MANTIPMAHTILMVHTILIAIQFLWPYNSNGPCNPMEYNLYGHKIPFIEECLYSIVYFINVSHLCSILIKVFSGPKLTEGSIG